MFFVLALVLLTVACAVDCIPPTPTVPWPPSLLPSISRGRTQSREEHTSKEKGHQREDQQEHLEPKMIGAIGRVMCFNCSIPFQPLFQLLQSWFLPIPYIYI